MLKKGILVAAALAWMAPSAALAVMAGGPHDLSASGPATANSAETQICVFCHVPHNGSPAVARPLWNHAATTQTLTWVNKTQRGTTMPADYTTNALAGSRGCMDCHDGTVALGALVKAPAAGTPTVAGTHVGAGGKLTAALSGVNYINPGAMDTNHPIGVKEPSAVAGFTTFVPTASITGAVNYDANGFVQCGSCHNPHDDSNTYFLTISNTGSQICTKCHNL